MAFEMVNTGYEIGLGLVRSTSFGRKRVAPPNLEIDFEDRFDCFNVRSLKRKCSVDTFLCEEDKSVLEDLPQEILVRILCGVEHDDLKRLFSVSKAVRQATLIAKKFHFAYSTPRKTLGFRNADDFGDIETPKAPKQLRAPRSRLNAKKLPDISVSLFASDDDNDEIWPTRNLFLEMEAEI